MKAEKLLLELEELCEKGGYTIRKERGGFRGGSVRDGGREADRIE